MKLIEDYMSYAVRVPNKDQQLIDFFVRKY
jgi:hypothetical protein